VRTVFFGTGSFAVPIVAALADHPAADLVAVVTAPQRSASRGKAVDPPVAQWAHEHRVDMQRPSRLRAPDSVAEITALHPDLIVLADYGQIVPAILVDLPRHGALNLHPSLLPRFRGATPIPSAILAGDHETGVSLMRMDAGLDTGPVVAQWRIPLKGKETAPELEAALAEEAARLLSTTLPHWLSGEIRPEPQLEKNATLTRGLRREHGRLDPRKPTAQLERQIRAYQPWPGSFVEIADDRFIVHRAQPVAGPRPELEIGAVTLTSDDRLALVVSDGLLVLDEVQPAGGRRMSGADLARGRAGIVGSKVALPAEAGT
jgi:methionyl-tRNA formyltransferase